MSLIKDRPLRPYRLHSPMVMNRAEHIFDADELSVQPCGLFRAPIDRVPELAPLFADLIRSAPVQGSEWEVDIKVHMLMPGQYPCVPNWHCDNVPRVDGVTRYDRAPEHEGAKMYVWMSQTPRTEFLSRDLDMWACPIGHGELTALSHTPSSARMIAPAQHWIEMDQRTPHRGTISGRHQWRTFVRITHASLAPQRRVHSFIRRHSQVYLDANNFEW